MHRYVIYVLRQGERSQALPDGWIARLLRQ
jgi:hypothetical protein